MTSTVSQRAFELRRQIFVLAGECKLLGLLAQNSIGDLGSRIDAAAQLDDAGARLYLLHDSLGEVFSDVDQRLALVIRDEYLP